MERDIVRSSTRVNFKTFVVQYLLFNILIVNIFNTYFDIGNYDSAPYCADKSAEFVVINLEQSSTIFFQWFKNDCMKVNICKSHLLHSGNSRATVDKDCIESED